MRSVLASALLLSGLGVPATGLAQPLQPGEIELHIEALGRVAPDRVEIDFNLNSRAETTAEAEQKLQASLADLRAQLKALGVSADRIAFKLNDSKMTPVITSAPIVTIAQETDKLGNPIGKTPPPPRPREAAWARGTATVSLADPTLIAKVQGLRNGDGDWSMASRPRYSTTNPAMAQSLAIDRAFAEARSQADAYAGALGYRVLRILRVSNGKPHINLPDTLRVLSTLDSRNGSEQADLQATNAAVAIDFAIAPK